MSWRGNKRVYFAEACGHIKIGCSHDVEKRLRTVGEWIPFPITLLATMKGAHDLEMALHRMFDADWSHGEWFKATPRLYALIADIVAGRPIEIDTTAISTRRRAFIADKKRVGHKITKIRKAGGEIPTALKARMDAVPVGTAIPSDLLASFNAFADAFLASSDRTVGKAA